MIITRTKSITDSRYNMTTTNNDDDITTNNNNHKHNDNNSNKRLTFSPEFPATWREVDLKAAHVDIGHPLHGRREYNITPGSAL